ncbi:MAG: ATP-dependent DNA helicase RecQ [Nitrospirae bacterium]|nr:ATP-dependent DNA helicase RecQ [Nitrospirota bacterium]
MLQTLKQVFGYDSFRPNQREIIDNILSRRDVFAVMPTGGGKSLCFQMPAKLMQGTVVVISPLISLMKDQVDSAVANGLVAAYINSSLKGAEAFETYRKMRAGELELLYIAPERFAMPAFVETLKGLSISLFAIDEAHCISEWGHDFRPDYLNLSAIITHFPDVPIAAFTATATAKVQSDIIERLGLRQPFIIRASFDRPNLFYHVQRKISVEGQILEFLSRRPSESGIIYRTSRNSVDAMAATLIENGIRAMPYHAGLPPEVRKRNQELFIRDETDVIVATIAFGMGIDKSNVRFIIHADLPKNIEGYYQETGRCGRDGTPATCVLFYGKQDIMKLKWLINKTEDDNERGIALNKFDQVIRYASNERCRRRQLLGYFGERYGRENCGTCDVCADEEDIIREPDEKSRPASRPIAESPRLVTPVMAEAQSGQRQIDKILFERLRVLRKRIADEYNVPAYVIFHDVTLNEMCKYLPTSAEELISLNGVGQKKLQNYGRAFINEIRAYLAEQKE